MIIYEVYWFYPLVQPPVVVTVVVTVVVAVGVAVVVAVGVAVGVAVLLPPFLWGCPLSRLSSRLLSKPSLCSPRF